MSLDISLLRNMITQDTAAVQQLKTLLLREREQLEQRKQDELPAIIEHKAALIDQLNASAKQRQQVLQTLNLPTNSQGWDLFLQRNTATLVLRDEWQALVNEFEECKSMNEVNGKMVARSRQTLNHLLNLLRGQVAAPSLYTSNGTKSQQNSSYTVAKA